jgi:RHS repeat-associated protein
LSRLIQSIKVKGSPTEKDVVETVIYDNLGRISKAYVPFEANQTDGAYVTTIPTGTTFTKTLYENNSLNRSVSFTPPSWYETTNSYGTNAANEVRFDLSQTNSYYALGKLKVGFVTDPNGNNTIEYHDIKGRLIMTRRSDATGTNTADTYYLYDNKDRLKTVIPPGASLSDANLIFTYSYDGSDNNISKKTPSKGLEKMTYNTRDLLTFYQDANMRTLSKWMMSKYNDYGQPLSSGFWNDGGITPPLDNTATVYNELLTENTYDIATAINKGRATRSKVKILDDATTANWIDNSYIYDVYGRVSKMSGNNHIFLTAGSEVVDFNTYDFADNLIKMTRTHKKNATTTITIAERLTFDHRGRQLNYYHKINTGAEVLVSNLTYNSRNFLTKKQLGGNTTGTSFLQTINNYYNPQGWLTNIDAQIFKSTLTYDNPSSAFNLLGVTAQKNGNISTVSFYDDSSAEQIFALKYDYLNRLSSTKSGIPSLTSAGVVLLDRFNEIVQYDKRGNISTLKRNGLQSGTTYGEIDNLTYQYDANNSNQITKISEASATPKGFRLGVNATGLYTYDSNGNLDRDPNKKMNLTYFYNNLTKKIAFDNGSTIEWVYDANGNKLSKKTNATTNNITHYIGGIEYIGTISSFNIQAIYHKEGRCTPNGFTSWRYEYSLKDHLGNTRITFADINGDGSISTSALMAGGLVVNEILQKNHYYAFGATIEGLSSTTSPNKYQYNGKEWNDDFGLQWNDYGARFYDPWVGRWWGVDPMADQYRKWSPYNYAMDNPVRFIDPDGRSTTSPIYGRDGAFLGTDDQGLTGDAIVMETADFKQNMKHDDAVKKNLGEAGLIDGAAQERFNESFTNLPTRPDFDGRITLEEANNWYRDGTGQPLYADLSQVDFGDINSKDFAGVGDKKAINLFFHSNNSDDRRVIGSFTLKMYPNNTVRAYDDRYDFEMHSNSNPLNWARNLATVIGEQVAGQGISFPIKFYSHKFLETPFPPK